MNKQQCKPFFTSVVDYALSMPKKPPGSTRATLAENVKYLRDARDWSQTYLAKVASVPQKTISNIEANRHSVSLDAVNRIAQAFGLEGWHLIIPNLPRELIESPTLSKLVDGYVAADPQDRKLIDMIAARHSQDDSKAS